jgi:3-deoxy-D-manno-octulosonic-acid transferase
VAGSIEPEDDGPLADAVRLTGDEWRWLLVPHATTPGRLDQVESAFRERGVAVARWDGGSAPPPGPVTLLARQGLLADLYYAADAAWVGGGFRAGGLHAACEAAAVAVPILAGPLLATVRDGRLLARAGAATPVDRPAAAARRLRDWAAGPSRRVAEGLRGRAALEAGAAGRTAEALAAIAGLA